MKPTSARKILCNAGAFVKLILVTFAMDVELLLVKQRPIFYL